MLIENIADGVEILLQAARDSRPLDERERAQARHALARLGELASEPAPTKPELGAPTVAAIVRDAVARKRDEHARFKRARIEDSIPHDLPPFAEIHADAAELSSLLGDLIDKSVASLGGGQGVVRAVLRVGVSALQITVEDNGQGLSDELLRRARERSLANARSANGPAGVVSSLENKTAAGDGGLAVERARIMAHAWGGRAEASARLGAGARVDVTLPRIDSFAVGGARASARAYARQS